MSNNSSFEYNSVLSNSVNNVRQNGDAHSSNGIDGSSPGYSYSEMVRYSNGAQMNGHHSTPIRNVRNGHHRGRNRFRNHYHLREQEFVSRPSYEYQEYDHDIWYTRRFDPRTYVSKSMVEDPWKDLMNALQNSNKEVDVSGALDGNEDESVAVVENVTEEIDVSGALDGSDNESDVIVDGANDGNNHIAHEDVYDDIDNDTCCSENNLDPVGSCDDIGGENNEAETMKKDTHNEIDNDAEDQSTCDVIDENGGSSKDNIVENVKDEIDRDVSHIEQSVKDHIDETVKDQIEEGDRDQLKVEENVKDHSDKDGQDQDGGVKVETDEVVKDQNNRDQIDGKVEKLNA